MADLHSILWRSALDLYGAGDPRELARLIRSRTPAPADPVIGDEVCAIVADLIEGRAKVPRKRGPLPALTMPQRFALHVAAHELADKPEDVRVDLLGLPFGLSRSAVRAELKAAPLTGASAKRLTSKVARKRRNRSG